jgi:hypothetical protein
MMTILMRWCYFSGRILQFLEYIGQIEMVGHIQWLLMYFTLIFLHAYL